MTKYTCLRCEHSWLPRIETKPVQCPHCKSRYWDEERADNAPVKPENGPCEDLPQNTDPSIN